MADKIVVGCRGSRLSLAQEKIVIDRLALSFHGSSIVTVVVKTLGDSHSSASISQLGGVGIFTTTLQEELQAGKIDMAVHSLKDLPTVSQYDTNIYVVERTEPRDVLISRDGLRINRLRHGARIGTSSPRRRCQLLAYRRDLDIVEIRGNVDTRLSKLESGSYDAIVLAAAGVKRIGLDRKITQILPLGMMLPAPGQGALAIEVRGSDSRMNRIAKALENREVRSSVNAEREFLSFFGEGCSTPIGAYGVTSGRSLKLFGVIGKPDGTALVKGSVTHQFKFPNEAGYMLAERLLMRGANNIIRSPGRKSRLYGKRVLVTREDDGAPMRRAILDRGALPIYFPTIAEGHLEDYADLDLAIRSINKYDIVMITSKRAARAFFRRAKILRIAPSFIRADFAAVGDETRREIVSNGVKVKYSPAEFSSMGLVRALKAKGKKVLFPCSDRNDGSATAALERSGANVCPVVAYRMLRVCTSAPRRAEIASYKGMDFVTFTSPSSVREFVGILGSANARKLLASSIPVCIGTTTALECSKYASDPLVASIHTIYGIISTMEARRNGK